jgi:predicted RNase H-like HicB family nuclease
LGSTHSPAFLTLFRCLPAVISPMASQIVVDDRYVKVVAWDEEDQCYIGRCPGLMFGGVHGDDETAVYKELCQAMDEWIQLHEAEGLPLPEPTSLHAIEALG